FPVPMILGRQRPGKVGRRQIDSDTLGDIPQGVVVYLKKYCTTRSCSYFISEYNPLQKLCNILK
ncbi:MAG: hypothetical protein QHH06_15135, partial [Clostridiales bacterium]|nr:hypothetical protein [Clostridiales bacterium]